MHHYLVACFYSPILPVWATQQPAQTVSRADECRGRGKEERRDLSVHPRCILLSESLKSILRGDWYFPAAPALTGTQMQLRRWTCVFILLLSKNQNLLLSEPRSIPTAPHHPHLIISSLAHVQHFLKKKKKS